MLACACVEGLKWAGPGSCARMRIACANYIKAALLFKISIYDSGEQPRNEQDQEHCRTDIFCSCCDPELHQL